MQNTAFESDKEKQPKPEQGQPQEKPVREKEISITDQSSDEPKVEKDISRQRRAEVQNPLMHESY